MRGSQPLNAIPDNSEYRLDLRPVYYYLNTRERDGSQHVDHSLNLRARFGISYQFNNNLMFRGRTAMRISDNQDEFRFVLKDHTEDSGSYPDGTATVDELLFRWRIRSGLNLTGGRFQGRFPLKGFIPKGVDRYYASNLGIAHTDGIWVEWDMDERWRLHLIGSHNSSSGSSHAARAPLRFDESVAARFTGFANLQHRNTQGRWAQRELSGSVTPRNFYRNGTLRNHVALSGRGMYRPQFTLAGEEYLIGGEIGYIPLAPRPSDSGLLIDEDRLLLGRSAMAWQISAYANKISKRHSVGILYGQTDPHWLISSSFAPNVTMAEIRYRYTIASWIHYEFRFRLRDEIYKPSDMPNTRQIVDFYTRFTISI